MGWRWRGVVAGFTTLVVVIAVGVFADHHPIAFTAFVCSAIGAIPRVDARPWCAPAIEFDEGAGATAVQVTTQDGQASDISVPLWPGELLIAPTQTVGLQVRLTHPARALNGVRFGLSFDPRYVDVLG